MMRRMLKKLSLAVLVSSVAFFAGCAPLTLSLGPAADQSLQMTTVDGDGGLFNDQVLVIDISGTLYNANHAGLLGAGDNPVGLLHERLEIAKNDSRIAAVILRLNTPGGTVTASDAMYREIKRFKKETGKPVVALFMDVTASGGYYVACAADEIVTYPTAITGSIGVIVQTVSFKAGLKSIGIVPEAITSGPNKDVGSPFTEMSPEHRAILKKVVDTFYARFTGIVKESRPKIPSDKFAYVTDGRVVTGEEAAQIGLADEVGDLYDAFAVAKKRAGLAKADLVIYHRPSEYVGSAYARASDVRPTSGTQVNVAQINFDNQGMISETSGFLYMWQPGE